MHHVWRRNVLVTGAFAGASTFDDGAGATFSTETSAGGTDIFLAKYSGTGGVAWVTRAGGDSAYGDKGRGVATDGSGNTFVTGRAAHGALPHRAP